MDGRGIKGELLAITSLRFAAALIVFLFHIHRSWPITSFEPLSLILNSGAIGMSLFFVLSGFVLSLRYYDEMASKKQYYINRFARIYPVYVIAALITAPFLLDNAALFPIDKTWVGIFRTVFIVTVDILMLQAWLPQLSAFWNNGGSWSISVEAFFYLMFPYIQERLRLMSTKSLFYLSLAILFLGGIPGISHFLFRSDLPIWVFYAIPIFRLPEFVLGMITGVFFVRGARISFYWAILALFVSITYLLIIDPETLQAMTYTTHDWIMIPAIAVTILACASLRTEQLIYRALSFPLFVYLGRISYSFYSIQLLVVVSLLINHAKIVERFPRLGNNLILCAISFLILTSLAALCYHLIEEPFRKRISKLVFTNPSQ